MNKSLLGRLAGLLVVLGQASTVMAGLPRSTPEAEGISSAALLSFIEAADKQIDSLHSFMLVRHGKVVTEGWWAPYNADSNHMLFSLSKSFTSTAAGMAIAEGKLNLSDEVLKAFPDDAPAEPSNMLKAMRLHDLLRMSTGQQAEPPRPMDQVWTKVFLSQPVPFKPGTHFLYNTSATYMASAMVQKATGQTVLDYLRTRLFEPLEIKNPTWEMSPQGVSTGGYGLSIRTEDIASFGQLYLQKGQWKGKQLVPASWVEAATARQTSNGSNPNSDWDQGYGYQFWRCRNGGYRGDGAFGQFCIVLPEQDAVVAITSGVRDMQAVMNLVWDKLLPEFRSSPLPPDAEGVGRLVQRTKGLTLRTAEGTGTAAEVFGKTYTFPTNERKLESIALEKGGDRSAAVLKARIDGTEHRIDLGRGQWQNGKGGWMRLTTAQPVAASGAWTAKDQLTAKLCFYETPFVVTVRVDFSGGEVQLVSEANVGPAAAAKETLTGKAN